MLETVFSAAYIYSLQKLINSPDEISTINPKDLRKILQFATQAASINCSRIGCQPPTVEEVDKGLELNQ